MNSNPYWLVGDNKSWFLGRHSDDYFGRQQGSWLFALFNLPGFNGGIKHCGENRCLSSAAAERLNREKMIKKSDFPRWRECLCAASVLFFFSYFTRVLFFFFCFLLSLSPEQKALLVLQLIRFRMWCFVPALSLANMMYLHCLLFT